ncbi:hypothetical protein AAVH_38409, partial [Aphelenchoides avenae]
MVTVRHHPSHARCCLGHAWRIGSVLLLFTCSSFARDAFEAIPQTFEGHLQYGVYIEPTYVILTKPEGRQLAFETATDHFIFDVNCSYGQTKEKEVIIREASSPNSCQMKVRCQQSPKAFNVVVSSARPGAAYLTLYDIATNPGTTTHLDISPVARRSNHVRDANSAPCVVRPQEVGDERYLWNLTFSADPDAEQLNVQM